MQSLAAAFFITMNLKMISTKGIGPRYRLKNNGLCTFMIIPPAIK
jgi:hypothetical protein